MPHQSHPNNPQQNGLFALTGPRYFNIVMAAFAVIVIVSNIASSAKIVDLGITLLGIRLAFDGGTLVFPLSYILGDLLTEVYGFRAARRVIWTGFGLSALTAAVFFLLGILPGEAGWKTFAGDDAYSAILGGISSGGIVLASLAGFLCGEFSNSAVLARIKVRMKGKLLFVRTITSTLAGELIDTVVFVSIATLAGVFPQNLFAELVVTNYIFKCTIEIVFTPLTCLAAGMLKKAEGLDVYDDVSLFRKPFAAKI